MSRPDMEAMAADVVLLVKTAIVPVLERLAVAETRLAVLGDLRDRVVTVETKAAIPAPAHVAIDLAPVMARLDALEATPPREGPMGATGMDGAQGPAGLIGPPGERGLEGPAGTPGRDGDRGPIGDKGVDGDRGLEGPAGPVRDGRDGLPGVPGVLGVPGEKGLDGAPGQRGVDGRDGTLENIKALFDGERTVTLCFKDGTQIDGGVITFPVEIWRGVYAEGKAYERCDGVTYGGSEWHCNAPTTSKPGDGSKDWTLKVKRGRDGKDGAPGADGKPGRDLTEKAAWLR